MKSAGLSTQRLISCLLHSNQPLSPVPGVALQSPLQACLHTAPVTRQCRCHMHTETLILLKSLPSWTCGWLLLLVMQRTFEISASIVSCCCCGETALLRSAFAPDTADTPRRLTERPSPSAVPTNPLTAPCSTPCDCKTGMKIHMCPQLAQQPFHDTYSCRPGRHSRTPLWLLLFQYSYRPAD